MELNLQDAPQKNHRRKNAPANNEQTGVVRYRVAMVRDSVESSPKREPVTVNSIVDLASDMRTLNREQLRAYFVDARMNLIGWELISQGTLTASLAHPREIMKGVILTNSAGFVLVHNHPSGDPTPSDEDIRLTKRIQQCAQIMGVELCDHIVIAESSSYSFKTAGML